MSERERTIYICGVQMEPIHLLPAQESSNRRWYHILAPLESQPPWSSRDWEVHESASKHMASSSDWNHPWGLNRRMEWKAYEGLLHSWRVTQAFIWAGGSLFLWASDLYFSDSALSRWNYERLPGILSGYFQAEEVSGEFTHNIGYCELKD